MFNVMMEHPIGVSRPGRVCFAKAATFAELNRGGLHDTNITRSGCTVGRYALPIIIKGEGRGDALPATTFAELNLGNQLLTNITRSGYNEPTPIQSYALPIIIKGKDVMACALTGSGRTATFVLLMINVINTQGISSSEFSQRQTPDAIVITPALHQCCSSRFTMCQ